MQLLRLLCVRAGVSHEAGLLSEPLEPQGAAAGLLSRVSPLVVGEVMRHSEAPPARNAPVRSLTGVR